LTTADRRRWEQLLADRKRIDQAATWLRERAWQESYAGCRDNDRAFQLAMLLDTFSLQLDRARRACAGKTVRMAGWLLGHRGT
jgi:hypothetical protein